MPSTRVDLCDRPAVHAGRLRGPLTIGLLVAVTLAGCSATVGGDAVAAGGQGSSVDVSTSAATTAASTPPSTTPPSTTEPSSAEPATTEPSTTEPSTTEPSTTEPSTAETSPTPRSTTPVRTTSGPAKKWRLPDPKPNRKKNEFGDIIAKPGESGGVTFNEGGQPDGELIFLVSKITVDPKCAAGAAKSRRGHFLRIDLEVEPRDVSAASAKLWNGSFSQRSWTAYDAKGMAQPGTDTDEADSCLSNKDVLAAVDSDSIANGTFAKGAVVLDVSSPKGTVVLDLGLDGGWEYQYG